METTVFGYPSDYVPCQPGNGGDLASASLPDLTITVDVNQQVQTIHGFGASDAWSIQFVGQWPLSKRQAIADLLFETSLDGSNNPIGAGLSAWRFNLGAGSSRQSNISDVWRRADTFLNTTFTGYDWTRLPGQRWFLQAAANRGVENFTAFVNSPPINMTKNGKAFCDSSSGSTNLASGYDDDFALYLATILEHFSTVEGIDFDYVSPLNEPQWAWEGGQEGCRYSISDIAWVVEALYTEIQNEGLLTEIAIPDSGTMEDVYQYEWWNYNYLWSFFNASSPDYVGDKVAPIVTSHSYFTCWPEDDRLVGYRELLQSAVSGYPGLEYAATEYCILIPNESWVPLQHRGYGNGRDLGIDPALWIARVIHHDLTIANSTSWDWWLGVSPYNYKDGLVYCDKNNSDGNYYESKMLWAMGNFSRFIRPGMKRIDITRSDGATPDDMVEDLMVSSYYHEPNSIIATVFVNWDDQTKLVEINYLNLPTDKTINYIIPYVTSSSVDLTAYNKLSADDTIEIPSRSVVTIVSMHVTPGDLEPDCDVDIDDIRIMASQWLQTAAGLTADIAPKPVDETVNFKDFVELAKNWAYGITP